MRTKVAQKPVYFIGILHFDVTATSPFASEVRTMSLWICQRRSGHGKASTGVKTHGSNRERQRTHARRLGVVSWIHKVKLIRSTNSRPVIPCPRRCSGPTMIWI